MAVKYAIANGNWATGATWNDGVVPVDGDLVYANGHNITCGASVSIGNGTLTNGLTPNTNVSGGKFIFSGANITIVANLEGVETYVVELSGTANTNFLVNGNISSNFGINAPSNNFYNNATLTFNGNIKGNFFKDTSSQNFTRILTINGVVDRGSQISSDTRVNHQVTLNGVYFASLNIEKNMGMLNYFEVIGKMYICDDYIVPYAIRINGEIDTTLSNVEFFPSTSSITFLGQSVITTKSADYPHPEDVRKNITYDFGQMIGTMEQTITNTNTINVYPYKKRQ